MSDTRSNGFMLGDLRNFGDILRRNAQSNGGDVGAICVDSGRSLTWSELNARANSFANAAAGLGVGNGDRIALLSENLHQYAEVLYGSAKIGAPLVNINNRLTAADIANVVREAEPSILVYSARYEALVAELLELGAEIPRAVVCIGGQGGPAEEYEQFIATAPTVEPTPARPIESDDPLTVSFSSGTTGVPKGVIWSHRGTLLNALTYAYNFELRPEVRLMMASALSAHCGMLVVGGYARCCLVFVNFGDEGILEAIEATGTQYLNLVPVLIDRLCEAQEQENRNLSTLTHICYGGSPISRETIVRATTLLNVRFRQVYSLTEACMAGCMLSPEDHLAHDTPEGRQRLISAGRPMLNVGIRLMDGDREVAVDEVGEVQIQSDGSMLGYWNNEELTAKALRDGWVLTGDLGYLDPDGYLFIVDRSKDVIVSGSLNVYAVEIERALLAHPAVAEAAAFGIPDADWGEAVHAAVVLRHGATADADELIEFCRGRVGGAKRPRSIEFLAELPRNALGKVVKRELRDPYWAGRERVIG